MGGFVLAIIGNALVADRDDRRRLAARIIPPAVDDFQPLLRDHRIVAGVERRRLGPIGGIRRLVTVQVGQDQIDMLAVPQRAVGRHAADRDAVIGFGAEAIVVEGVDRHLFDGRRAELLQRGARCLADARGDIFPPRLVGRDAQRLRGFDRGAIFDEALPALPREFVIVAHAHERKIGPGVLDIGIVDMRAIDVAVAGETGRHIEIADLARVGNVAEVVDSTGITVRRFFRIFDHFVDEVAEMEHKAELAVGRRALILPDHAGVGVLRAFVDAVAGHEGKANGSLIVGARGRDRPPDPAARAAVVDKTIPIDRRRRESADQRPARPVGGRQHWRARRRDDAAKVRIERHLDGQFMTVARVERPPGPQDDAMVVGVARRHTLGKEAAILSPCHLRGRRGQTRCPDAADPDRSRTRHKLPPVHRLFPSRPVPITS